MVVLAAVVVWLVHHVLTISGVTSTQLAGIYAAGFCVLAWQLGLCYLERPAWVTPRQERQLDRLHVVGVVPVYNEDPAALAACLDSMLHQTRRPQEIWVIDDGSDLQLLREDYQRLRRQFMADAEAVGVRGVWLRQDNAGKRHAQAVAFERADQAAVFWTSDSDSISDPHALAEMLKPLANPEVQSVAGVVLAANVHRSLLTRFTDLWFVTAQLVDRSGLSVLGSVWVNSGPIALYRASVVRDNLEIYLSESFFGRRVPFSDDSLLTLFAMMRGRTVQQPTAYAYSLMPQDVGHHARQYMRWMRGSFIRSWWRVRHLPLNSYAWWAHLARWVYTTTSSVVLVAVLVTRPALVWHPASMAWLAGVPIVIGYAQTLRYMSVRRSDQARIYQWGTWLLTPLAVVWSLFVLRGMRWWAIVTCLRIGWGTRADGVEVAMEAK